MKNKHRHDHEAVTCAACNGSGRYDSHGSPPCGACDGTGKEQLDPNERDGRNEP